VFDTGRFETLTLGDPALQSALRDAFLRQVEPMRQALADSCEAGEQPFSDAVHRLKSSVHFVGGRRLGDLLGAVEAARLAGERSGRDKACHLITSELDALAGELHAWRGGLQTGEKPTV
jgi:hypothetical protein